MTTARCWRRSSTRSTDWSSLASESVTCRLTWVRILQDAAERIPVVLASRTGGGTTLTHAYGFDGSEKDLLSRGLIGAGHLDPYKARLLLTVLLRSGADRGSILASFAPSGTTPEGRG